MTAALGNHPFTLSKQETRALGDAFRKAGFSEDGVNAVLGLKTMAAIKDLSGEVALGRTAEPNALNALIRLFIIGAPVGRALAEPALGGIPSARWIAGGVLKEAEGKLYAAFKVTPLKGLLVAFDRSWAGQGVEAADHVMGPSDSARLLSTLLLPPENGKVLDVGTGCGYLAFLAAREASRVVASDLNPRAAAFVDFNSALNGIDNVEARTGSVFEPVKGERFDLIISNPPFVISPEDRLTYANGGMKADGFCRSMAGEAAAYLEEGGHFQMLCNWIETGDQDWTARLSAWFAVSGCDAWALRSSTTDPRTYAENWLDLGHHDKENRGERMRAWLDYYREENIASIGSGTVTLRKRAGNDHWFRGFDGPARLAGPAGAAIRERMRALDFPARRAPDDAALLASVLRVSPAARLTQECVPSAAGWALEQAQVRLVEGLAYKEEIDNWFAELLIACDGARTLSQAVAKAAAALGHSEADIPPETTEIVRQLVDEGFLIPLAAAR